MPFDIDTALAELPEKKRVIAEQRVAAVHAAQRLKGMEPRKDSQLTFKYAIDDSSVDVPSSIANELVIVDMICQKTFYCAIIEYVMRIIAFKIKRKYTNLTWTDTWDITRFYVPSMLKLYCVRLMR